MKIECLREGHCDETSRDDIDVYDNPTNTLITDYCSPTSFIQQGDLDNGLPSGLKQLENQSQLSEIKHCYGSKPDFMSFDQTYNSLEAKNELMTTLLNGKMEISDRKNEIDDFSDYLISQLKPMIKSIRFAIDSSKDRQRGLIKVQNMFKNEGFILQECSINILESNGPTARRLTETKKPNEFDNTNTERTKINLQLVKPPCLKEELFISDKDAEEYSSDEIQTGRYFSFKRKDVAMKPPRITPFIGEPLEAIIETSNDCLSNVEERSCRVSCDPTTKNVFKGELKENYSFNQSETNHRMIKTNSSSILNSKKNYGELTHTSQHMIGESTSLLGRKLGLYRNERGPLKSLSTNENPKSHQGGYNYERSCSNKENESYQDTSYSLYDDEVEFHRSQYSFVERSFTAHKDSLDKKCGEHSFGATDLPHFPS